MLSELKIAVRRLVQRPSFAAAAIGTLAVGIGAATAIFSAVNVAMLRPLPYPGAEDIYTLSAPFVDGRWSRGRVSGAYVAAVDEQPSIVAAAAVASAEQIVYSDDGEGRPVLTNLVNQGFFDVFGSSMAAGRAPTEDEHGAVPARGGAVAVISHRLWTEMFGRDPGIVDRPVRLSAYTVTLVGVAPPNFDVPRNADVWIAFRPNPTGVAHTLEAYLRVQPGTSRELLDRELATAMAQMVETYPAAASGRRFVTVPLVTAIVGDLGAILMIVLGGALALLLVASVNVATLILSQGVARSREVAVRIALGAERLTVVRGLFVESLVLAGAGSLAGLAIAWIGVKALPLLGADGLPRMESIPFDARVLAFAATVLVLTTVVTTLLPSMRLATPDVRGLINEGGRSAGVGRATHRLLTGLVVAEIALAVVLVSGAGWLVRSYANVTRTDLGFEPHGRLVFTANLAGSRWAQPPVFIQGPDGRPMLDPNQPPRATQESWLEALTERLEASPYIERVGSANTLPLATDWDTGFYIGVPGEPYDPENQEVALLRPVSAGFFEAMGTRLIAGRDFTSNEGLGVAIVNEAFVRRFLPGRDPVGASFAEGFPTVNFDQLTTIIGVVADVKYATPREDPGPLYYIRDAGSRQVVVVETTLDDPADLVPLVQDEVVALDPAIRVIVEPLSDIIDTHMVRHRAGLVLLTMFAAISLALAGIGIFGVVTHVTGQRAHEMATRIALGATASDVRKLVMRRGYAVAAGGLSLGLVAAFLGGRVAASRLYEVQSADPLILFAASGLVGAITWMAFLAPAVRAGQRSPREGLAAGLK